MKSPLPLTIFGLLIWSHVHIVMLSTGADAKSLDSQSSLKQFVLPTPPITGTPSGRSQGGGSRGGCQSPDGLPPLTALVPAYEPENRLTEANPTLPKFEYVWSYTTDDHPTFWFYTPYLLEEDTEVLFVFQDQENNTLPSYSQSFHRALEPGIISVTLPNAVPPLAIGERYRWFLQIYCDAENPDFVEGWVYRIALAESLENQLQSATLQEQVRLYASNGIWQDALTRLAQLRQIEPDNIKVTEAWQRLLELGDLSDLVSQPFSECCSLEDRNE